MTESDRNPRFEARVSRWLDSWFGGLDEFFETNKHLFTLIGVFGAFSIYLRKVGLPTDSAPQPTLGTTSALNLVSFFGFGIVLLLFILIYIKLIRCMISTDPEEYLLRPENTPFFVFGLLLAPLVATIVRYLSTFTASAALFWTTFVYLLSPMTIFRAHERLLHDLDVDTRLANKLGISRFIALEMMLVVVLVISLSIVVTIQLKYGQSYLDALMAGRYVSQRWLLLVAMFAAFWFYASSIGIVITILRQLRAIGRNRITSRGQLDHSILLVLLAFIIAAILFELLVQPAICNSVFASPFLC